MMKVFEDFKKQPKKDEILFVRVNSLIAHELK
jgi:hypothetical protein